MNYWQQHLCKWLILFKGLLQLFISDPLMGGMLIQQIKLILPFKENVCRKRLADDPGVFEYFTAGSWWVSLPGFIFGVGNIGLGEGPRQTTGSFLLSSPGDNICPCPISISFFCSKTLICSSVSIRFEPYSRRVDAIAGYSASLFLWAHSHPFKLLLWIRGSFLPFCRLSKHEHRLLPVNLKLSRLCCICRVLTDDWTACVVPAWYTPWKTSWSFENFPPFLRDAHWHQHWKDSLMSSSTKGYLPFIINVEKLYHCRCNGFANISFVYI